MNNRLVLAILAGILVVIASMFIIKVINQRSSLTQSQALAKSSSYLPPHSTVSSQTVSKKKQGYIIDIDFDNDNDWKILVNHIDNILGQHIWQSSDNTMAQWINSKENVVVMLARKNDHSSIYRIAIGFW